MLPVANPPTAEDPAGLYQLLPIPKTGRWIRILSIQPQDATAPNGGPLRATMGVVNLDSTPSFTALSYVWAQGSSSVPYNPVLHCGEYVLRLTANCASALVHLRRQFQGLDIWIDACCINQADPVEKSKQIPLLGDIYSSAKEVYLWLGEGTAATDRAVYYLNTTGFLEHYFCDGQPNGSILEKPRMWAASWTAMTSFCRPCTNPFPYVTRGPPWLKLPFQGYRYPARFASYYDIDELLTREWHRRIWTYQEIMLARHPVVVCGDSHIPWCRFALSIIFLNHFKSRLLRDLKISLDKTLQTWKKIVLMRQRLIEEADNPAIDEEKIVTNFPGLSPRLRSDDSSTLNSPDDLYIVNYRKFLYSVTARCVMIGHISEALGYLSLLNMVAALIAVPYTHLRLAPSAEAIRDLHIYTAVSIICFLIMFTHYAISTYSYCYFTMFALPRRDRWKQTMRDDSVDDFTDAIISRKASIPQDVAFGLHSVLAMKLGHELPPPDYTAPLGQIYKDFTESLLHATRHLQFLLPAAAGSMPGQPSWVPNWSAEFPQFWLQPFAVGDTVLPLNWTPRCWTFLDTASYPDLSKRHIFELDGHDERKLTISGHHLCTIGELHKLHESKSYYDDTEHDTHLKNLTVLQKLCTWIKVRKHFSGFFTNNLNFPNLPETIEFRHTRLYWQLIWRTQSLGARYALRMLKGRVGTLHPMPYGLPLPLYERVTSAAKMRIHIAVCNNIVRTRRQFFAADALNCKEKRRFEGVCSYDAQIGDRLIVVPGLSSLLVVRPAENGCFRLVSPAALFTNVQEEIEGQMKRGDVSREHVLETFTLI